MENFRDPLRITAAPLESDSHGVISADRPASKVVLECSLIDGVPMIDRILRLPEVRQATGMARSSIYAGMENGTFPKSVPITEKAVGWLESEIKEWQEARIAARAVRAA